MSYHNIKNNKVLGTTTKTSVIGGNLIKSIKIDSSPLGTLSSSRSIQINGDDDAVFSLQVSRSSNSQFYDFSTNTFSATYGSQSRLKNQNPGNTSIVFPANASGDTYTIYVWPEPHFNTELGFGKNKFRYIETIEQSGTDAVVTFSTDTSISTVSATSMGTSSGNYINSYTQSNAPTISFLNTQLTVPDSISDYGVKINNNSLSHPGLDPPIWNEGDFDSNALYWETGNYVADGAGTSSTSLILTSVDDLYIGMQVSYVNSVFQTALRAITAIDTTTKTVTLNGAETWSDTHVIKFRAYGLRLLQEAIGITLALSNSDPDGNPTGQVKLGQISTTLRTAIESGTSTANVNGTTGISIGATVRCSFLDKSTSTSASTISASTPSTTVGDITVTNSEFTSGGFVGDIIYIDGYSNLIYLSGIISIIKYPIDNQTIYIDISKFLTIGTTD